MSLLEHRGGSISTWPTFSLSFQCHSLWRNACFPFVLHACLLLLLTSMLCEIPAGSSAGLVQDVACKTPNCDQNATQPISSDHNCSARERVIERFMVYLWTAQLGISTYTLQCELSSLAALNMLFPLKVLYQNVLMLCVCSFEKSCFFSLSPWLIEHWWLCQVVRATQSIQKQYLNSDREGKKHGFIRNMFILATLAWITNDLLYIHFVKN